MKYRARRGCRPALASPPARGRGLKLLVNVIVALKEASPPARGRGLKSFGKAHTALFFRRPPRGGVD